MVEKKLNFNQPILSVRRIPSSHIVDQRRATHALPHGLEQKYGPMRNPGSVPFMWEQSPGRPKEEILAQSRDPDGETLRTTTRFLDETSGETSEQSWSNSSEDCSSEVVVDQEPEQKRVVVCQDRPIQLDCWPNLDKSTLRDNDEGDKTRESDKHEHEHEHDQDRNVITVCCLLPRSCLKSAVCNLNPVPAMSVVNRVMTFPGSRMLSATSLSSSSTESENEYKEHAPNKRSFKTLQELLSDDAGPTTLKSTTSIEVEEKIEDDHEVTEEIIIFEESDDESSGEEDTIRVVVERAAKNAREKLSRAKTLGKGGVSPPPLPESPSDSWLFRAVSAKKAASSASIAGAVTSSGGN